MDLILSEDAEKDFLCLPKSQQAKVRKKFLALRDDPMSGKKLSGELSGYYSFRAWPYRVIYQINQTGKIIEVSAISHRQGAYK